MTTQEAIDYLEQRLGSFLPTEGQENYYQLRQCLREQKQIKEWEDTTGRTYNRGGPK